MANKTNRSPLNQFGSLIGSMRRAVNPQSQPQPQSQNMFTGGLSGAMRNAAGQAQQAQQMQQGTGTMNNTVSALGTAPAPGKKQMMPSPINPRVLGDPNTVKGVYGNSNPNTFTRSVGSPINQTMDGPVPVPTSIQDETSIAPNLGFNNL
jgi:hypothetical protein